MYSIGIDVGTSSVRCGIVDLSNGRIIFTTTREIDLWNPIPNYYEQSSTDIWNKICKIINESLEKTKIDPTKIIGIGYDATCSMVVVNGITNEPVSISLSKEKDRNIIIWMDHRAINQANRINQTKHKVLNYVGGKISPEMEIPKLLWVKENLKEVYENEDVKFFDLADWLVYKSTGQDIRSLCTVTCKWNYTKQGWDDSYFKEIGLEKEIDLGYNRIGTKIQSLGESVGKGLTKNSAKELGLNENTPVAVGIIDAHSGGVGSLNGDKLNEKLCIISGTSSCHMIVSKDPKFVDGVWGPFYGAMIPDYWLTEGGQSTTGKLIDHLIQSHRAYSNLLKIAEQEKKNIYEILNSKIISNINYTTLTSKIHVLPYFHGNRSPISNPNLKGMITGLEINDSIENLSLIYLSTIQSIGYGTKHIILEMESKGHQVNEINICGGLSHNPLFVQEMSDILQMKISLSQESDVMILGASILAACAGKAFENIEQAMNQMNHEGKVYFPNKNTKGYHEKKYSIFRELYFDQLKYEKMME